MKFISSNEVKYVYFMSDIATYTFVLPHEMKYSHIFMTPQKELSSLLYKPTYLKLTHFFALMNLY